MGKKKYKKYGRKIIESQKEPNKELNNEPDKIKIIPLSNIDLDCDYHEWIRSDSDWTGRFFGTNFEHEDSEDTFFKESSNSEPYKTSSLIISLKVIAVIAFFILFFVQVRLTVDFIFNNYECSIERGTLLSIMFIVESLVFIAIIMLYHRVLNVSNKNIPPSYNGEKITIGLCSYMGIGSTIIGWFRSDGISDVGYIFITFLLVPVVPVQCVRKIERETEVKSYQAISGTIKEHKTGYKILGSEIWKVSEVAMIYLMGVIIFSILSLIFDSVRMFK